MIREEIYKEMVELFGIKRMIKHFCSTNVDEEIIDYIVNNYINRETLLYIQGKLWEYCLI